MRASTAEPGASHPAGMYVLAASAALHNFAFWGVAALFPFYTTSVGGLSESDASEAYGTFLGASMALPLVGGVLVSHFQRCTALLVVAFASLVAGASFLAFVGVQWINPAFGLVALGYGLFWPAVIVVVGNLYDDRQDLRDPGFTLFYALASAGVFAALVFSTLLLESATWESLYLAVAGAGALGLAAFLLGGRVVGTLSPVSPVRDRARHTSGPDGAATDRRRVIAVVSVTGSAIFFWIGCSLMGSNVEFFLRKHVHFAIAGVDLPPIVFLCLTSFAVVVLGPVLAHRWSVMARRGSDPSEVQKIAISIGLLATSYALLALVAWDLGESGLAGPIVLLLCSVFYLLHAGGMVIVAPAGMAFLTRWAPSHWTGALTGLWFLASGLGTYAGGLLTHVLVARVSPWQLYTLLSVGLLIVAIVLAGMNGAIHRLTDAEQRGDPLRGPP